MKTVLALDLASVSGWALGRPGSVPTHGTIRFAAPGATHEAIFSRAMGWMESMCGMEIDTVVWESPLQTSFKRGHTNANTTTVLYGLPAVVGAIAYHNKIYDIRKADTKDVRMHFLGCNPKRSKAKQLVKNECRRRGWDVKDDNEADALAIWDYMCALIEPRLARQQVLNFGKRSAI